MNGHKFDFASDVINIIALIYDYSTSMRDDVNAIRTANAAFYEDFSRFEEKGSIAISKMCFSDDYTMTPFASVSKFDTSYRVIGGTKLYRAITAAAQETIDYYTELTKRLNVRPRITFLVFTDGEDNNNYESEISKAKQMITRLNSLDATTVLVAFRDAIASQAGEKLGFTCTRDISSTAELVSCLGTELSRSCKEQSKSAYSLKSQFFSKAATPGEETPNPNEVVLADSFFNV